MARSEVQRCLDWLLEQQVNLDKENMGINKATVSCAVNKSKSREKFLSEYKTDINKVSRLKLGTDEKRMEVEGAYSALSTISKKKTNCLDVLTQIASLEDTVGNTANEFCSRAVHLVNVAENNKPKEADREISESLAKVTQKCVVAVRHNWKWIQQTMKCAETHLKHAANYHEFFNEAGECEFWMQSVLSKIHMSFDRSKLRGDQADVRGMMEEIKAVLLAYLQWQSRVDLLFEKSKDVVPLPLRSKDIDDPRPGVALCDYRDDDLEVLEGSIVTILDNSDNLTWKIRSDSGQEGNIPAICILMPSPYGKAVDTAVRLKLQLLALWTTSVKRLGYQLIAFMLLVFKDWDDDEVKSLQMIPSSNKEEILSTLKYIEGTLASHWGEYPDFQELQERLLRLRVILEEANGDSNDDALQATVVVQIKLIEDLLKKYKDFWDYWETFKVLIESLRQPKYILTADKWDELRYVTTAHFVKFWDTQLQLDDITKVDGAITLHETPLEAMESHTTGSLDIRTSEETAETDQITRSVEEERRTFVIKTVIDPRDEKEMSIQHAIMLGIVDQARGKYTNLDTGESIPIAEAMNEGKILVEFTSTRKIKQEKSAIGLITIKTKKETRPYIIKHIADPKTDRHMDLQEAIRRRIYDDERGMYKSEDGQYIPVIEAIENGAVVVEYTGEVGEGKPETVTRTYAVHTVVDQRRRTKIPFTEAIHLGILDRGTGNYNNNLTGEKVQVSEAIKRGFIKARVVADPNKLDIDPENKIVIERIENVKNKLLRSMKTVRAFQLAAKEGQKNKFIHQNGK